MEAREQKELGERPGVREILAAIISAAEAGRGKKRADGDAAALFHTAGKHGR